MRKSKLLALAFAGLAIAATAAAQAHRGALSPVEIDMVKARTQKIRELKFLHPVPMSFLTPDQVRARIRSDIDRRTKRSELRLAAVEGAMIGLYPPGVDLEKNHLDFLETRLAGFYDPHRGDLVIVDRPLMIHVPARAQALVAMLQKLNTAGVLAHELTHALQDQHFHIGAESAQLRGNSDREIAYKSVLEGDATLSGFGAVVGRMDDETIDYYLANDSDVTAIFMGNTKGFQREQIEIVRFQYSAGARFVAEAFRRRGWNGVDALYRDPPASTQQIIHPKLYFDHPTPPERIHVAGYGPLMQGWKRADEDTFGALVLRVILERVMGAQTPYVQAASWWTGDHCVALQKGNATTLIWIITFKQGFADNFAQLYSSVLEKVLPKETAHHVETLGNAVLVLIGAAASQYRSLAPAVWKASTIVAPAPTHAPWPAAPARQTAAAGG
jgi:hypothetical protein